MTLGKNFRLPLEVRPTRYRADLRVDVDGARFEGRLAIDLNLGLPAQAQPRRAITLHAVELDVTTAELEGDDGIIAAAIAIRPDAESETLTLEFPAPLSAGTATLRLAWSGRFSPGLRGLYRAGSLAVTQFEAADARRVFPCFDEPAFKATWQLILDGVAPGVTAISNGAILSDGPDTDRLSDAQSSGGAGRRRIVFAPTPPLSSYLVALVLGDQVPSEPASARGIPIRTWSVPEKRNLTGFAQTAAAAVLPLLEDYFGLPYPFGKLDQIGVPNFEAGAMENAGAITFREVALLLDVATAPLAVQKRAAEVITHELAHQWFGNLVTMVWWDDLWLNEAFATWMAYKIVDAWRPEWRIWMDFEMGKGSALVLDALQSAHPIRADVRNAEEAGESFDAITYEKGGAVLRMIEGFLREDRFREGIRLYMRRHREGNATADDLWGALGDSSGQPIVELANGWIRQMGYPLVEVKAYPQTAARPTPSRASPSRSGGSSPIPRRASRERRRAGWCRRCCASATPRASSSSRCCCATPRPRWFSTPRARSPGAWPTPRGAASYRAAYEPALLARLVGAIDELGPEERLGLVSDQWALVRAGQVEVAAFLDLVSGLGDETDHVVLEEILTRLSIIEHRHVADDDRAGLHRFIAELFAASAARLGWGTRGSEAGGSPAGTGAPEDDETRLRRAALLRARVLLARVPEAIAEAEARYVDHIERARRRARSEPARRRRHGRRAQRRRGALRRSAPALAHRDRPGGQAPLPARARPRRDAGAGAARRRAGHDRRRADAGLHLVRRRPARQPGSARRDLVVDPDALGRGAREGRLADADPAAHRVAVRAAGAPAPRRGRGLPEPAPDRGGESGDGADAGTLADGRRAARAADASDRQLAHLAPRRRQKNVIVTAV